MTTNIPPHNFNEVIDTCVSFLKKENKILITGPDYPTAGKVIIEGKYKNSYKTCQIKATISYEKIQSTSRHKITITEIPYGVNKPNLVKQIANLMFDKKLDIDDVNDASDKKGICIEIKTKANINPEDIINILYAKTECTTKQNYVWNLVHKGKVKEYNITTFMTEWLEWRKSVVLKKCDYYIKELKQEKNILDGLLIFYKNRKQILNIISQNKKMDVVKVELKNEFKFNDEQLDYILKMSISRINGLEEDKINQDLDIMLKNLNEWIANKEDPVKYLITDLNTIKSKYGNKFQRKTKTI